jgi:nucleoside-diphosphate-sugar epimerase
MAKPIAITGATGFAGGAVLDVLRARGRSIRALARDPAKLGGVETVQGGLGNIEALERLMAGADTAIHIAGAIAAPSRDAFFETNEAGTRNAIAAAARAGVKRFVHISSLAAREPQLGGYGASKRAGEAALEPFGDKLSIAVIRPPAVYGPGDTATLPLLQSLMQRVAAIPGRADARLSVIYVEDLARMIADAAGAGWTGIREVSDGTAGGYRWRDLTAAIARAEGRAITPVHLPRWLAEAVAALKLVPSLTGPKIAELYFPDWVARGEADPGFETVRFQEGFVRTAAWYRAKGWLKPGAMADRSASKTRGDAAR